MNNATLTSNVGGIVLSGAGISGTGAITTTGAASGNGGNISITGTSTASSINLTGVITTSGERPQPQRRAATPAMSPSTEQGQ